MNKKGKTRRKSYKNCKIRKKDETVNTIGSDQAKEEGIEFEDVRGTLEGLRVKFG